MKSFGQRQTFDPLDQGSCHHPWPVTCYSPNEDFKEYNLEGIDSKSLTVLNERSILFSKINGLGF